MPIPVPPMDKKGNFDLGECIRHLRRKGYSDSKQRIRICLETARKAHGKRKPEGVK